VNGLAYSGKNQGLQRILSGGGLATIPLRASHRANHGILDCRLKDRSTRSCGDISLAARNPVYCSVAIDTDMIRASETWRCGKRPRCLFREGGHGYFFCSMSLKTWGHSTR
jgi:hypothetical protein